MPILLTKIKNQIICEFLPPAKSSNQVVIFCFGMPSYPGRRSELMEFFSKRGYWVFIPRYRGSWESTGKFLAKSPHLDVIDIINQLPKGFKDLWSGEKKKIFSPQVFLIGSSFGGPAALLASADKRVKKVVALAPVVDWLTEGPAEPLDHLARFVKNAFTGAYRSDDDIWKKLRGGKFYSPSFSASKLVADKIMIFHARDDEVVPFGPTAELARKIGAKFVPLESGGHGLARRIMEPFFWRKINKFLK